MNKTIMLSAASLLLTSPAFAQNYQDMSNPLSVYSQIGAGVSNDGLHVKFGHAYDTNNENTKAMHVLEIKGFFGDSLWLDGNDSVSEMRYRHFNVDVTNGLGSQFDANWDFDNDIGYASYSLIQALPSIGRLQLYPLAGVGMNVADGKDNVGYYLPSSFGVVGMYSKLELTDSLWLNYNPMYTSQLGGDSNFKSLYGIQHETALSYQLDERQNVRAFWNWGENMDGTDFRVEYNIQF